MYRFVCASALALAACSGPSGELLDAVEQRPDLPPIAPHDECVITTGRDPAETAAHVAQCSALDVPRHPPVSGAHYGVWADFGRYDAPVPYGFLIHAMEHGAVVLVHRGLEEAESAEVLAAFARIAASVSDPGCRDHPNLNRVILTVDPELEVPIAALAWEHVYLATCLDEPSLRAFVEEHYGQAPENFCTPGIRRDVWCP